MPDARQAPSVIDLLIRDEAEALRVLEEIRADRARLEGGGGAPESPWCSLLDLLGRSHAINGRVSTGLSALDRHLDGGLYAGTLVVIQGKPGIGKTSLATQIALHMGRTCAVASIFADEGEMGARVRIAQQLGADRVRFLAGAADEVEEARAMAAEKLPFWQVLESSDPLATIEHLADQFDAMAPLGLQRVWLVDSVQVVRTSAVNGRDDRRVAVAKFLMSLRDLAKKHSAIALAVSQVSRGSYRSKNKDENVDPLSAGLETSSIEFMADLILHLDGNPKETVTLRCVKNRISANGNAEFPLRIDFPRARFVEVDEAATQDEEAKENEAALLEAEKRVIAVLLSSPRLSGRQVRDATHLNRGIATAALKRLTDSKRVAFEAGQRGAIVWFCL